MIFKLNQELLQSGTCDPLCSIDEISSQDFEASYQPKTDLLKALAIIASATVGAVAINHSWVAANQVHPCSVSSFFTLCMYCGTPFAGLCFLGPNFFHNI